MMNKVMRMILALALCSAAWPVMAVETVENPFPQLEKVGDKFRFVLNADPQMGPKDSIHEIERRLYGLLEDFVDEVNAMEPEPAFVVFDGDQIAHAKVSYFNAFEEVAKNLEPPVALVHGNHDGVYPDDNFLRIQQTVSGFQALQYSFDCGQWHFAVIPARQMVPTPEMKQELLEWLDADLEKNRGRPTMLFVHYHLLPVGLSQLEYYTLPMDFKTRLLDTVMRYGNVRHVISGHVHAGVKSSIKSSWTWNGIHFIIAPSPVPPRRFGEEFPKFLPEGEKDQGYYLVLDVDGKDVKITARKTGMEATHVFPDRFKTFDADADPRAFKLISEVESHDKLINGDFEQGLEGWLKPYRYLTDKDPAYVWKTRGEKTISGDQAAYLYVEEKGHDWAYDESIEMYQLVELPADACPVFKGNYYVPTEDKSHFGGGYIRFSGYSGTDMKFMMFFHWGAREDRVSHLTNIFAYTDHGISRGRGYLKKLGEEKQAMFWEVPDYYYRWGDLEVNFGQLYDKAQGRQGAFDELGLDKILVAYGVWCGMEPGSHSGALFDNFRLNVNGEGESKINDKPVKILHDTFEPEYSQWYLKGYGK